MRHSLAHILTVVLRGADARAGLCQSRPQLEKGLTPKAPWAGQGHPGGQWGASSASTHTHPALSPVLGRNTGRMKGLLGPGAASVSSFTGTAQLPP